MGRVLLVAGSKAMPGAAVLSARAALRGGAGSVVLGAPACLSPDFITAVPEAMLLNFPQEGQESFGPADVSPVLKAVIQAQAIVVGPGLGSRPETGEAVSKLLEALPSEIPRVLDADALNHLASHCVSISKIMTPQTILTPHLGEAARLLGWSSAAEVQANRREAWRALVKKTGATILLKGPGTLVGHDPTEEPWVNQSGNPGMATAGSGDVLAGLLGALCARGTPPVKAARLGTYLHGRAGDIAAEKVGEESLSATDLVRFLPNAIQEVVGR